MTKLWWTENSFSRHADEMRSSVDEMFGAFQTNDEEKAVWQVFYIPGQYAYLKTMAYKVFSEEVLKAFRASLYVWGLEHLGAVMGLTEPQISLYTPGCGQELHNDSGSMGHAWVYSLCHPEGIRGGSTVLTGTEPYWGTPRSGERGAGNLVHRLVPEFNRLMVFDTRVIHAVDMVQGAWAPRDFRVVVQGQFAFGGLHVFGDVPASMLEEEAERLDKYLMVMVPSLYQDLRGGVAVRVNIDSDGHVRRADELSSWLVPLSAPVPSPSQALLDAVASYVFNIGPCVMTCTFPLSCWRT